MSYGKWRGRGGSSCRFSRKIGKKKKCGQCSTSVRTNTVLQPSLTSLTLNVSAWQGWGNPLCQGQQPHQGRETSRRCCAPATRGGLRPPGRHRVKVSEHTQGGDGAKGGRRPRRGRRVFLRLPVSERGCKWVTLDTFWGYDEIAPPAYCCCLGTVLVLFFMLKIIR